jgi:hypothetical protein
MAEEMVEMGRWEMRDATGRPYMKYPPAEGASHLGCRCYWAKDGTTQQAQSISTGELHGPVHVEGGDL